MSLADELLNNLTDEEIEVYTTEDAEQNHIVIGADRFITVPSELKRIAVQHDENVEVVTFDCPRYWKNLDMSKMKIYINYMLPSGKLGCYCANNVVIDELDTNIMHFDWNITSNATPEKGTLSFLVCIKKKDAGGKTKNHWNSELNREMYVSAGLECEEAIIAQYPDIITQILEQIDGEVIIANNPAVDKSLTIEGFAADAKATGRAISVERARIDALQAIPEGSTSADAALYDINIGYDGTDWKAPGAAVRGQIGQLANDLENYIYDVKNGEVHDGYAIYLNDGNAQLSNIGDGYSLNTYKIEKDKRYIIKTNSSIFRIAFNNSGFVANYFLSDYQQLDGNSVYEFTATEEYNYIHVYFKTPKTPNAQGNLFEVSKNTLPNIEKKIDEITIMNIDDICDFEIGNINSSTGEKIDSTIRMRSSRKIRLNKGDVIKSNIYGMVVVYYDRKGKFIGFSYPEYQTWTRIFEMKSDYDVIIVCRKDSNESPIKNYDLVRAKNSIYISTLNKTMSSYISSSIAYSKALDGMASLMNTNNDISVNLYQKLGKLTKSGKNIIDSNGNNVVLTGIGTHSISEYNSLYTEEVMKTLTYYGLNCIRISVYLTDKQCQNSDGRTSLGWLNNSDTLKPIIEELIEVATNAGLYIIIDWHSYHAIDGGDVTQYKPQQEAFFEYFSNKYSNQDNILYELHNEPYRNTASELLDSVISCANIIRNHNPDAILICGEGNDGVITMDNLFNKTNNLDIFISPHLYTGEQTIDYINDRIRENRPIFVTEWGNSSLSGDGLPNDNEALKMFNLCHSNNISYCLWKMTYQDMDTAILNCSKFNEDYYYGFGGWSRGDLSHNGKLYFDSIYDFRFAN